MGHGKAVQEHSPLLYIDLLQGGGCGQDRQPRRHRQPSSVQLGCEIHRRLVLHPFYSLTIATTVHINHSDFPHQGPSGVRRDGLSRGDPEVGVDKAAHLLLPPALHPQVDDSDVVVVDDEDADLLFTPSGLFVTLAWATMFFPTNVAGIRAQYNVQITNLIST